MTALTYLQTGGASEVPIYHAAPNTAKTAVASSELSLPPIDHLVIHNYLVLIPQRLYSCGGIHNALQTDPYCFDAGFAVTLAS